MMLSGWGAMGRKSPGTRMRDGTTSIERLTALIYDRLLPEFCNHPSRGFGVTGFKPDSIKLHETDARDFLRAWDSGLLEHIGRGQYRAAKSAASEQWFWSGAKGAAIRSVTLWLEPVITVAAMARLHLDLGWPKDRIGAQSLDWAFDAVGYLPGSQTEYIACEVKKTPVEVERLVSSMTAYCADRPKAPGELTGYQRNAYRKLAGLDQRQAPLFWVVGPGGLSRPFHVHYEDNRVLRLETAGEAALQYPA